MKTLRAFGVELELNGQVNTTGDGRTYYLSNRWDRYRPHEGTKMIVLPPGWRFVADGSCGIEFISPPSTDTIVVRRFIRNLHDSCIPKYTTFQQCGLHVHVGATDLEPAEVLNVGRFCRYFDRAIYSFFDKGRKKNQYCRPIMMSDDAIRRMVDHPSDANRYLGCNINAMSRHGTIEFRYSEGHLDIDKIEAMVDLFTRIVEFGRTGNRLTCKPNLEAKRQYLLDYIGALPETRALFLRTKVSEPEERQNIAVPGNGGGAF